MHQVLLNLLYYYGMRGVVKECLLQRYFSKVASDLIILILSYCNSCLKASTQLLSWSYWYTFCRRCVATLSVLNQTSCRPAEL
jgi:hypothetical protein